MNWTDELAAEYLRQFEGLLNPEIAQRLAEIADSFYHYRAARVHSEPYEAITLQAGEVKTGKVIIR